MSTLIKTVGEILTGYIIAFVVALIIAFPLFFLWNALAPVYFTFLPTVWTSVPYMHMVGIVWMASIIASIVKD